MNNKEKTGTKAGTPLRLLVVEDSPHDTEIAVREIRRGGFDVTWKQVETAAAMRAALDAEPWDAIVADYRMPHFDGVAALRVMQEKGLDIPFIIVSGTIGEETAVAAMKAGAHDYLIKGNLARLAPVVERELREAAIRTERKRMEESLRESENRYRLVFEASTDGILIADTETRRFKYTNSALCRMLGYTKEELGTMDVTDIHPKEDLPRVIAEFEAMARGDISFAPGIPCLHKDGSTICVDISVASIKIDGKPCSAGFFRDITERKCAEDELKFRNTILSTQQEVSIDGILVVNENGGIISSNRRFADMWGIPSDILASKSDERVLQSVMDKLADPEEFIGKVKHLYKARSETSRDEIALKDGRTFDRYSAPMFGVDGKYYGRVWYFRDITEHKRVEKMLHTGETQLSNALKMARAGHWEYDVGSDVFTFNDNFYRIFRTTAEKVGGYKMSSADYAQRFCHPDDAPLVGKETQAAIETTDPYFDRQLEHRIFYADGEVGYMAVRFFIVKDQQGRTVKTYGVNQDITERKRMEDILVQNFETQAAMNALMSLSMEDISVTEFLERALNLVLSLNFLAFESKGCIFLADKEGKILHLEAQSGLSDALLTMCSTLPFGRCLCGRAAAERTIQFADHVDDRHEIRYEGMAPHGHYCVPILSGDRILGVLNLYVREGHMLDGHVRGLYVRDGHVRDQKEEEFLKAVANTLGGTIERKRAEEDLREANMRLRKSMEELQRTQQQVIQQERLSALGQMASGIAHDFNNVLMPIVGFSELLISDLSALDDRKETRHMLDMILSAGNDARQIVRRLRAVYRDDDADDFKMVDISRIVESAISMTMPKWKEELNAKGITIEMVTDFHPIPQIKGNESEIRDALINLIFNAVDAMPKGGVIAFRIFRKNDISIVLEVTDTGLGMNQETLRHCMEPFFTTKGVQGSGLGLAMVHGIVERHDGTVEIESTPGAGTTIRMLFPVPIKTEDTKKELEKELEPLPPLRILVIDDEARSRNLITRLLKTDAHHVELAEGGSEGLAMLRRGEFDLIITDRAMPLMSGDEVAKEAQKIRPGIPVIMLTGFGDIMKDEGKCPSGVIRVMTKPVTRKELRSVMAKVMAGKNRVVGS